MYAAELPEVDDGERRFYGGYEDGGGKDILEVQINRRGKGQPGLKPLRHSNATHLFEEVSIPHFMFLKKCWLVVSFAAKGG